MMSGYYGTNATFKPASEKGYVAYAPNKAKKDFETNYIDSNGTHHFKIGNTVATIEKKPKSLNV